MKLHLALLQSDLHWQNPTANLAMFEEKIWQIKQQPDIIILPEMFTTGFTMEAKNLAEPMNLTTFKWLKQQAAQTQAALVGSYIVVENDAYFNRLVWMQPDGQYFTYDKRHLFRMANEHQTYTAGSQNILIEWKGWRIRPLICYDLRFPVWSRNVDNAYDLLIYIANWPVPRVNAWDTLLQARAIENLAYVAGVNRVGTDGKELNYCGNSAVYDFKGNTLYYRPDEEETALVTIDKASLDDFRQKFPVYLDADSFHLS